MGEHERVVRRQRLELVRGGSEGQSREFGDLRREALRELRVGIEPGADRRAALSEGENIGQRGLDAPDAVFDLRRVA